MKKILRFISVLMMLAICISAVSCGGEGDDTTMNNPKIDVNAKTKVGDKITLGTYEQNGDAASKEPISWTVIKVEEGRALLLSDLCLLHTYFHNNYEAFSWEDCDVRDMLNKDFYSAAFTDEEKTLIEKVRLENDDNYIFLTDSGNDTTDSVFLLSLDEANTLLDDETIIGVPTEAVKKTANLTHGKKSCNWWLRTQGATDMKAVAVGYNGVINYSGLRGDIAEAGIRPCVWYKTETNAEPTVQVITFENIANAQVGDKVAMGKYDADANEANGAENIIWSVAASENGKLLLVADNVIDASTYYWDINASVDWNSATLKLWLNGTSFLNKAFSDDEKAKIVTSTIVTKGVNGAADITTYNQIFVLSAEELVKYFPNREDRMVKPTETAVANGVYADPIYGTCDYWVREAGTTAGNGAYVYYYGDVNESGALARSTFIGVRPAMWVKP